MYRYSTYVSGHVSSMDSHTKRTLLADVMDVPYARETYSPLLEAMGYPPET